MPRPTPSRFIAVALAGLSLSTGCSWIFTRPPPDDPSDYPDCTTSRVPPAVDTVFATTNLVSAGYVAVESNSPNKGPAVLLGMTVGIVWLTSALYGYSRTSACLDAQDNYEHGLRYRHPLGQGGYPQIASPPAPAGAAAPGQPSPPAAPQQNDTDGPDVIRRNEP
jgi:hypothetical protein